MTAGQPLPVVVLISGTGTNLQALIDAARTGQINAGLSAVYSNRAGAPGLERARNASIDARHLDRGDFSSRAGYDTALGDAIERHQPGLVVLAGFMHILGPAFVTRFHGRIMNIHPALLPRHRGLDTHRKALEAGDSHHGATVHFATEQLDAGPRIIQYRLRIRPDDTPVSLSERVLRGEHVILPRAVGLFADGRLRLVDGTVMLDGKALKEPLLVEADE